MNADIRLVGAVLIALAACGRTADKPASPTLGSIAELRERAERAGCTPVTVPTFFGSGAFTCTKVLEECGCTLVLDADTTDDDAPRITLVRMSWLGCAPGEGDAPAFSLLEPLLPRGERTTFQQFVAAPRHARSAEQARQLAAFQAATFGHVSVRALFGAVSETGLPPRRVLWLDPHPSQITHELVPDATSLAPRCDRRERRRGYCEERQGESQCHLTDTAREADRNVITFAVTSADVNWRGAVRAVGAARILQASSHPRSEVEQATVLLEPLWTPFAQAASIALPTVKPGINALQLAAEAAADWRDRTANGLAWLPDPELEALLNTLPKDHEVSRAMFEQQLRSQHAAPTGKAR